MIDIAELRRMVTEKSLATAECSLDRCGELVLQDILNTQFVPPPPEQVEALRAAVQRAVEAVRGEVGESVVIGEPVPEKTAPPVRSMAGHWKRYKHHLLTVKKWHPDTVTGVDLSTTQIVARLPEPSSSTGGAGRGLVLGYVQSGKTANMMGVIAKAADQGWNLVIILAGLTNVLREQTQGRVRMISGRTLGASGSA